MIKDYKKATDRIIKKSFKTLIGKKFFIVKIRMSQYSAGAFWPLPFLRIIFLSPKINDYTKLETDALIAHELSHFEIFKEEGWFRSILNNVLYWLNQNKRTHNENETDTRIIRKGYARGLYLLRKKSKYDKKTEKHYITPSEIKSIAIKMKKW